MGSAGREGAVVQGRAPAAGTSVLLAESKESFITAPVNGGYWGKQHLRILELYFSNFFFFNHNLSLQLRKVNEEIFKFYFIFFNCFLEQEERKEIER